LHTHTCVCQRTISHPVLVIMSFFLFSTHEIFENKKLKSFNVYLVIGNVYLCISINICINLMIEKREEEKKLFEN
jgi:hypothetical protein